MLMWSIDVIFLWSLRKFCVLGVSLWLLVIHFPGDLIRADKFRFNELPPPSGGAVVVRFKELWLCQPPDCPRCLRSGLVTNSILFCWLITIKDRYLKVRFQQTCIEGFCQLFLIVSVQGPLHVAQKQLTISLFLFSSGSNAWGELKVLEERLVSS